MGEAKPALPAWAGQWLQSRDNLYIAILAILYAVGIVGITLPLHPDFVLLTPLNLLISLWLMLLRHPHWDQRAVAFLLIAYVVGFAAELFGTQTGLLFGDYTYGRVLGPKLWDTPLMIGVNWALLAYAAGILANRLLPGRHWLARGALAASLMVGLDVLIEPVAMALGFWSWAGDVVPLRNYLGWFAVALPLQCLFAAWLGQARNKVAVALFIMQSLFFFILRMLL